jgi:malonate transporter and related proteins
MMVEIFLRTLPFFAIIGLGYGAGRTRFFTPEATAYLTKFVFYFALSAMLFRFSSGLSLDQLFNGRLIAGYLCGTAAVYGIATAVGFWRGLDIPTTAIEAQCAAIGNVGFLGIPMLAILLGTGAVGPVILILATDLIVFSSLIVILVHAGRDGRISLRTLRTISIGLVKNPMIVSISLGLLWSALKLPMPAPFSDFLSTLGAAATPGALFAIGASLAVKSAERYHIAGWLSFCKLILHPLFVAIGVLILFPLDAYTATVVISASALPVAGNVFMLAQHYGIAPQRVSSAILFSTATSIFTVPIIIAWASAP